LSYSLFIKADLEDANLNEVNLEGANFYGAKLISTKMMFAQLGNANFRRADLRGVDFRGAKGLTAEQLYIAKTLFKARLSPDIKKQIEDKCPFMFYEPEQEESIFWANQKIEEYFAYGSNMCSKRLKARSVAYKPLGVPAVINDYSLVFNKTSKDGSSKANITSCPGRQVWGVLYNISDKDMEALNNAELGYKRKRMTIKLESGIEKEAFVYIADWTSDTPKKPYTWYVRYLVVGAREHKLPAEYIYSLEAIEATEDCDLVRDHKERTIILGNN
jgi:cation transport regulator ChaC